ncbi:MAG: hypothetical protein OJF60_003440 [Burkholderiaceae bacterium]|nr:MAG: hypothetical protein OJF60_003440 [Burkholderiaceae bacterium]
MLARGPRRLPSGAGSACATIAGCPRPRYFCRPPSACCGHRWPSPSSRS